MGRESTADLPSTNHQNATVVLDLTGDEEDGAADVTVDCNAAAAQPSATPAATKAASAAAAREAAVPQASQAPQASLPFDAQPLWSGPLFIRTIDTSLLPLGTVTAHLSLTAVTQVSLAAATLTHLAANTPTPSTAPTAAPAAIPPTATPAAAPTATGDPTRPPAPLNALILQESRRSDPGAWPGVFAHALHSPSGISFPHAAFFLLGQGGAGGGGGVGEGGGTCDGEAGDGAGDAFAAYVGMRMRARDVMCDVVLPGVARVSFYSSHLMSPACQSE
ncbi:unnamed protein product [Closterium sp. NIES-65]|nr:unnamed protein product [Closterium sp. NIES-65]